MLHGFPPRAAENHDGYLGSPWGESSAAGGGPPRLLVPRFPRRHPRGRTGGTPQYCLKYCLSLNTVKLLLGFYQYWDKARYGRPRIDLSAPDVESLLKEGIREGMDCTQLLKMLSKEKGIVVGRETVRLHLNAHLARQLRPKKKPRLTESHKQKRLVGL